MFILHKAQLFYAQIKAPKCASRDVCARIKDQTHELASHQTHNVHALAWQLWWHVRLVLVGRSGSKSRAYFYSQSIPAAPQH